MNTFYLVGVDLGIESLYRPLYSCSPRRVSRKLWIVYETMHAAVTQTLCVENLLLRARFVMTPAPGIKLCAIAAYHLFHSHAQVLTFTDLMR